MNEGPGWGKRRRGRNVRAQRSVPDAEIRGTKGRKIEESSVEASKSRSVEESK
jgi:hypothetical protein